MESSSIAWPVASSPNTPAEAARFATVLLADGMPAAMAASKARRHSARLRALIILSAASLIEAGLVGLRARNAMLQIQRMAAADIDMTLAVGRSVVGGVRFWLAMLVASCIIAVAFGSLAFVSWWGAM